MQQRQEVEVRVKLDNPMATLPERGSVGAAGLDIRAMILTDEVTIILSGKRELIPTGLSLEIPEGYYGQLMSRSGLASKGIDVGAGVIDSDYRGEVKVLLINNSDTPFIVHCYDRIAQLIILPLPKVTVKVCDTLSVTDRDKGGFGSTGI